jgi:hypothetical protein
MVSTQDASDNSGLSSFSCVVFCTVILFPVVLFDISATPVHIIVGYDMLLFSESCVDNGCLMFMTLLSAVCYNYRVVIWWFHSAACTKHNIYMFTLCVPNYKGGQKICDFADSYDKKI